MDVERSSEVVFYGDNTETKKVSSENILCL
jgi:hypothetical protein